MAIDERYAHPGSDRYRVWYYQQRRKERRVNQGFSFSPSWLFENGAQGAWYDPSDRATLFQDAAGTIPVTADGDPVGLMLDKSGNFNHASQATSAARPIYRRGDKRGLINRLLWTEDFSKSDWTKINVSPTSGEIAPDSTNSAWKITDDATNATHLLRVNATPGSEPTPRTYSIFVKGGTARYVLFGRVFSGAAGSLLVFDTQTGTYSDTGSASFYDSIATPIDTGNGWWELSFFSDSDSILASQFVIGISNGPTHETDWSYSGTGSYIYIWHPQMEIGSVSTDYQRNDGKLGGVAANDLSDLHWLEFDGVDDFLVTTDMVVNNIESWAVAYRQIKTDRTGAIMAQSITSPSLKRLTIHRNANVMRMSIFDGAFHSTSGVFSDSEDSVFIAEFNLALQSSIGWIDGVSTTGSENGSTGAGQLGKMVIGQRNDGVDYTAMAFYGAVRSNLEFGSDRVNLEKYLSNKTQVAL